MADENRNRRRSSASARNSRSQLAGQSNGGHGGNIVDSNNNNNIGNANAVAARDRFSGSGGRGNVAATSCYASSNSLAAAGSATSAYVSTSSLASSTSSATTTTTTTTVTLTLMPKSKATTGQSASSSTSAIKSKKIRHQHDPASSVLATGHHGLRERWLLTRKTWRYMADAGRKLIPDAAAIGRSSRSGGAGGGGGGGSGGGGNRGATASAAAEDLPRIEEYFQQVCRAEPKFLPWRRKASYPGALNSLRRRKRSGGKWGGGSNATTSPVSPTSPPKASSADEAEEDGSRDEGQRLLLMIRMLEKFLNIRDEGNENQDQLLEDQQEGDDVTMTLGVDQQLTGSLYYERHVEGVGQPLGSVSQSNEQLKQNWLAQPYEASRSSTGRGAWHATTSSTAPSSAGSSLTSPTGDHGTGSGHQTQAFFQSLPPPTSSTPSASAPPLQSADWAASMHTSLLLENLRHYSRSNRNPLLSFDRITSDVLADKRLLRQIRDELKQQQLERVLRRHSSRNFFPTSSSSSVNTGSSLFSFWQRDPRSSTASSIHLRHHTGDEISSTSTTDSRHPPRSTQARGVRFEKRYATTGCQTDPIPITHLQQIHVDYRRQTEAAAAEAAEAAAAAAAEAEAEAAAAAAASQSPTHSQTAKHSRRKSSTENEDVSQSVSDTIKRYLRMARKKSVHESDANRFKRVNYDQTLRNIKPKGEITMPGDDDGLAKGAQTEADWIERVMVEVRALGRQLGIVPGVGSGSGGGVVEGGDAIAKSCIQSIISPTVRRAAVSPPPSPSPSSGGLFQTGTQFLSNLLPWHSTAANPNPNSSAQPYNHPHSSTLSSSSSPSTSTRRAPTSACGSMQPLLTGAHSPPADNSALMKSKSSSNVTQVFTKKIFKSRSKSQSRTASPSEGGGLRDGGLSSAGRNDQLKSEWLPQGNGVWTSLRGDRLCLQKTRLFELGDAERLALHRVAIDRIGQLNIGCQVVVPDVNPTATPAPKKRRQMLLKRKALTTGFFDTAKAKEDAKPTARGLVFGIGLQSVVDNDARNRDRRSSHSSEAHLMESQKPMSGSCESLPANSRLLANSRLQLPASDHQHLTPEDELQVPNLVRVCCDHLLEHGMSQVGIFRVGTVKRRVDQLKDEIDRGEVCTIDPETSAHDVAYLLKDFLRCLPEPLLCRSLYTAFVQTQKIRNRRLQLEAMSHLIQLLPVAHRDTLFTLLNFLGQVAHHAEDQTVTDPVTGNRTVQAGHRMDSINLATVMSPNILHDNQPGHTASESEAVDRLDVINVVRTMIDHCEELFAVPVDVLDDVYAQLMDADSRQLDELCDAQLLAAGGSCAVAAGSDVRQTTVEVPRRVYVRQEFMHQNTVRAERNNGTGGPTVIGGDPSIGTGSIKRRERTSKMRYQEPENEAGTNRRRRGISSSGSTVRSNSTSGTLTVSTTIQKNNSYMQNHSSTTQTVPASGRSASIDSTSGGGGGQLPVDHRRLSTPFVQHDSGVMSASFQLPVKAFQTSSTLNLAAADLDEIPYIEEGSGASGNSGVNVGGTTYVPPPDAAPPMARTGSLKRGSLLLGSAASAVAAAAAHRLRSVTSSSNSSSTPNVQSTASASVQQRRTVDPPNTITIASLSLGGASTTSSSAPSTPARTEKLRVEKSSSGSSLLMAAVGLSKKSFGLSSSSSATKSAPIAVPSAVPSDSGVEHKASASISTIGNAVLRSKTADFERLLQSSKTAAAASSSRQAAGSKNGAESSGGQTKTMTSSQTTTKQRSGPIYKRQELIASRQSSKK